MVDITQKFSVSKRLALLILVTVVGFCLIGAASLNTLGQAAAIFRSAQPQEKFKPQLPIDYNVTYIVHFDHLPNTGGPVSDHVYDKYVTMYSELLQNNLQAELGQTFDSVLKGFAFHLPAKDAVRECLMEDFSSTNTDDFLALLYRYMMAFGESLLKSNHVGLHLEKNKTILIQHGGEEPSGDSQL